MSSMSVPHTSPLRPPTLLAAVAITVISTLIGNALVVLGGPEGSSAATVIVGAVSIGFHLLAVWGLWLLRRWSWIVTIGVTIVDGLLAIPFATSEASDSSQATWFTGSMIVFIALDVVVLALLLLPATRRALRRG